MAEILIIEDNQTMREGMVAVIEGMKQPVTAVGDGKKGLEVFAPERFSLVITDYKMPGMDGLQVLQEIKRRSAETEVMIITAYGTIDLAVTAMQEGAADFITKPFGHDEFRLKVKKLLDRIRQNTEMRRLTEENIYLREELENQFNFGEIIGESTGMQQIYRTIKKVAITDASVMIYGESGTGKELVARALHKESPRKSLPFVRVNCGALAEGVLESELFGHERGSFTGAMRRKKGRFELAHNGTIFLDEIGDIPLGTQVKLLRVLQEKEFERVGGEETLSVDVRVIAATHRNLQQLVENGSFREDLYYRLHIIPIYLPPLRERGNDIILLSEFFLTRIGNAIGKKDLKLTKAAVERLLNYHWPGNVRELENVLERAAVLSESNTIDADDLPLQLSSKTATPVPVLESESDLDLEQVLESVEKRHLEKAMTRANGIKTDAARMLGIKTSTLYYKLEKYGLLKG